MKTIKGLTALITGASSGIGYAFAHELAAAGCHLILTARSEQKLQEIAIQLRLTYKVSVTVISGDLSLPGTPFMLYNNTRHLGIEIDLLINNAGFGKWAHFLDEELEVYEDMVEVNINALVKLTHLFLPGLLKKGAGGIINVCSTGAFQPCPYISVYCATKAFVLSFSEALYGEYKDKGVTVTALCPGNTDTPFFDVAHAQTAGLKFDTPATVAKAGIRALLKGRNYQVVGLGNYIQCQSARFLPRKTIIGIVKNMFQKKIQTIKAVL